MIKASEAEAQVRGSPVVRDRDLAQAASKKIPTSVKPMALSVLEELGINIPYKP